MVEASQLVLKLLPTWPSQPGRPPETSPLSAVGPGQDEPTGWLSVSPAQKHLFLAFQIPSLLKNKGCPHLQETPVQCLDIAVPPGPRPVRVDIHLQQSCTRSVSNAETSEGCLVYPRALRNARAAAGLWNSWVGCGASRHSLLRPPCLLIGPPAGEEPVRKLNVRSPRWPTRTADQGRVPAGPGRTGGARTQGHSRPPNKQLQTFLL